MKKILTNLIFFLLSIMLFVFFLYILGKGINYSFTYDYSLKYKDIFIYLIVFLIVLISSFSFLKSKNFIRFNLSKKGIFYLFFFVIFILNVFFAIKISNIIKPVSDFAIAYEKAVYFIVDKNYDTYYYWWTFFSIILRLILKIFNYNILIFVIINAIFSTLSSIVIYFILTRHFKIKNIFALLSIILFAFYPNRILFLGFVTPDFFVEFGLILISYLFFEYLDVLDQNYSYKNYLYPIFIVFILSFASLLKPIQSIFLVLFIFVFIINFIKNGISKKIVFNFIYFFLIYFVFSSLIFMISEKIFYKYTNIKLNKNFVITNKLYVGLNSEGKGYWDERNIKYLESLGKKYNYDTDKMNKEMKNKLLENIKGNSNIINMLVKKVEYALLTDYYSIEWFNKSNKYTELDLKYFLRYINKFNLFYYIILFFLLISLIFTPISQNIKRLYLIVFIFGFIFTIVLGESQPRYKFSFTFLIVILSLLGINDFYNFNIIGKTKKFLGDN
jgi:membrane protein